MKAVDLSTILYILKCLAGLAICYLLYKQFPAYPFYWSIVSVVITISPDSNNKLAYDRIIANVLGCAVSLCLYPVHASPLFLLCGGVAITIILATWLKLTAVLRSALAALVIVIITEGEGHKNWMVALERVACVIIGCAVALIVTLIFNRVMHLYYEKKNRKLAG